MSESWSHHGCPTCKEGNWLCHGDGNDCTAPDTDPYCKCWACGEEFWWPEEDAATCYPEEWAEANGDPKEFKEVLGAGAEEGRPRLEWDSAKYERFLDSASKTGSTWRYDLISALDVLAGAHVHGGSVWKFSRNDRRRVAERLAGAICRNEVPGIGKKEIYSAASKFLHGKEDSECFKMTMHDLLQYLVT